MGMDSTISYAVLGAGALLVIGVVVLVCCCCSRRRVNLASQTLDLVDVELRSGGGKPIKKGERQVKCVVVGDGAVGKTSLLISYATNTFPEEYVPTVFDNHQSSVTVSGKGYGLDLWDTAGQEEYDSMRALAYPRTDVFIVVFSLTSAASLSNVLTKWHPELQHHAAAVPVILVGAKADVAQSATEKVDKAEIDRVTKACGARSYLQCSALTQQGLNEVFVAAVRAAVS